MLQALINKGRIITENIPPPQVSKGNLLIKTIYSCISAGTELGSIQNSGTPLIKRALKQPDNVKKVLKTINDQGIFKAYSKIKSEVNSSKSIGYSLSGVVVGIGSGVTNFTIGEKVTASGAGVANHAEYVDVPINLVTKIPKSLSLKKASTVTMGSIAMQGVRRADLRVGEMAVVYGCGILGLITIQILKASGVRVCAVDIDSNRLKLAKSTGSDFVVNPSTENAVDLVDNWSGGFGADVVLFTAATNLDEPLSQSFKMCRKKGKLILVGVSGMNIKREDIYKKEIDFLISSSYGPGRYDNNYELKGIDYPYPYVRWTQNRNMDEYLRLLNQKLINIKPLINSIYKINDADKAYESLKDKNNKPLIVLLNYGKLKLLDIPKSIVNYSRPKVLKSKIINYAIVGSGSFATNNHIPNLSKYSNKFSIHTICNRGGAKAHNVAKRFGARFSTTNYDDILNDNEIDLVIICTRHDSHSKLVLQALESGKHVMVEKPLSTNQLELDKIKEFYKNDLTEKPILFVGFNRRFSKYSQEIKKHLSKRLNPLFIRYRMNAGYIPHDSWVHESGGRIVGEACHLIDLMTFFTGSKIKTINCESIEPNTTKYTKADNKVITLKYEDGSICSIDYFAIGNSLLPKEYMEIHFDNKSIIMNDYKLNKGYGLNIKELKNKFSDKGHEAEILCLYDSIIGINSNWPIKYEEIIETTEATLQIVNQKN
jgi:predicted dehydrogenase/threonine dehydrogenase-like Zn-dependent dehydrogenase